MRCACDVQALLELQGLPTEAARIPNRVRVMGKSRAAPSAAQEGGLLNGGRLPVTGSNRVGGYTCAAGPLGSLPRTADKLDALTVPELCRQCADLLRYTSTPSRARRPPSHRPATSADWRDDRSNQTGAASAASPRDPRVCLSQSRRRSRALNNLRDHPRRTPGHRFRTTPTGRHGYRT